MLRLFTDEHISPRVASTARRLCPALEVTAIRDWHAGHLLGASDEAVLREAGAEGLTLVTYDLRTIPPCCERGRSRRSITAGWSSSMLGR